MITRAENLKSKEKITLESDGIFVFAGMVPNTGLVLNSNLNLSEQRYILTNEIMETNLNGVYAAGDVRVKKFRQITTAIGDGTIAALAIIQKG
jgi:thioredoxin reductase (NADPH)